MGGGSCSGEQQWAAAHAQGSNNGRRLVLRGATMGGGSCSGEQQWAAAHAQGSNNGRWPGEPLQITNMKREEGSALTK